MSNVNEIRRQLQEVGTYMMDHDLAWGNAGNISARTAEDHFLITASGTYLGELLADDFVEYCFDGKRSTQDRKPSKEIPMHQAIYEERSDIHAILHASPFYSTLIACSDVEIPSEWFVESMYYLERCERVSYHHPGSTTLGEAVREKAAKANILFLENHGVLVFDTSVKEARMALQTLEFACRMFITANGASIPMKQLPENTVQDFLEHSGYKPRRRWKMNMIGVIADDITGSNDIGVMFGKSNYIADIFSYGPTVLSNVTKDNRDVLIFDTDSRLDDEKTAYDKVYQATLDIQKAGADQFFNKTCSVFRGNIGSEFDAMLDALKEEFAIVVLGFPKNGRTTLRSIHYVYGDKLQDSQFKDDPIHPMKESNLVTILQSQTSRRVGAIHEEIIKQGSKAIKQQIQQMKINEQFQYIILDVTNQNDLYEIAKAVYQEKIICGSSALAEEIPKVQKKRDKAKNLLPLPAKKSEKGLFCAAGSLMPQTYHQINYMKRTGNSVIEFDTFEFLKSDAKNSFVNGLVEKIVKDMLDGKNVVFHSTNTNEKVRETKAEAAKHGLNNTEISKMVSETIAHITSEVIRRTEQYRFVIAGGDTSATVCRTLGIEGMRVWKEIQPGLPSCLSHTNPPYLFVLKSGSFGNETFIEEAFEHLLQW
ncbi:hypothetical protein J14TS2_02590 [Bacillus sp. J14TS2]|uniref:four-carbon acid sugar kinase family protein n=1 Tax=Bacillus sp. J14TS2 TaxID=2807188 RepID=UPI001B0E592C|nr:four-carbon acid sugar kinase family protein [Bacillus sp. J14TS2]GIN69784.1 hypothetical protein J14TS2_02590 [Bacillus sp. J14TS2]